MTSLPPADAVEAGQPAADAAPAGPSPADAVHAGLSPADAAPAGLSPAGAVHAAARLAPERVAVVHRGGGTSFAELIAASGTARTALDALGLPAGQPIAVRAAKSPQTVALILACFAAARPVLLLSVDLGAQVAGNLVQRAGCAGVAAATGDGAFDWVPAPVPAGPPDLPPDTCLMLTTSGSTGVPKIVPLTGAALGRFTGWAADTFALGAGTRVLSHAPLNFDLSLLDVWATLAHGGTVVLVDPDRAANPAYLLDLVSTTRPHVVQAVPMFYRLLVSAADGGHTVPEVRHVVLTGEHTPPTLRAALPELFPGAVLHNVYGCTETNDSFIHSFGADEARDGAPLPLGTPLPGVHAHLAGDDGEPFDGPGTGELVVSTPFQAVGYLAGDRFPVRAGRAWYRTGDLVTRDDRGRLVLVGRTDFQVKIRGVRVSLEEVEQVLLAHPDVAEAAVVALPDAAAGARISAVLRPRSSGLTSLQVRTWCAQHLTRAAIPAVFDLRSAPLPVGVTGKVDRARLTKELTA
ncbi:AMP-binding protein [Dactylosporangium sp. NPDC005555]|uniref:AMP-binding protein n=1 Tax=Dactylosporangium sp. NPDC005555 TaxID=3154889 RepID=UPI0033ADCAE4